MTTAVEQGETAGRSAAIAREARADKAPGAFRTIREVAEELGVPQHVLRFWESRFGQVRPLKRAGGRRYYRPEDVDLLKRIQGLLYQDGYTIRGVQKLFRDGGVKAVRGAGPASAAANHAAAPAEPIPTPVPTLSRPHAEEKPEPAGPRAKRPPAPEDPSARPVGLVRLEPRALAVPRDLTLDEKTRARLEVLIDELEDLVGLLRSSTGS